MKYLFRHFTFILCILLDPRKISYRHQIAEFYLNSIHSSVYAFVHYDVCACMFCVHAHVYSPWCLYGNQRPALGVSLHPPPPPCVRECSSCVVWYCVHQADWPLEFPENLWLAPLSCHRTGMTEHTTAWLYVGPGILTQSWCLCGKCSTH